MYKAITDRIIVRLNDCPQTNKIKLPESASRNTGTVLNTGPAVRGVYSGDEIIFHVFDELPLPQKNLAVVREKSVLGIIEKNKLNERRIYDTASKQ